MLATDGVIRSENLPPGSTVISREVAKVSGGLASSLRDRAAAAEVEAIREALARTGGRRKDAAKLLGISVRTLFYKLRDLGIGDG